MATVPGLEHGKTGSDEINLLLPTDGTPVNGSISQGTLTVDTQPLADDTMTIGDTVYTFTADGTAADAGEIDVGADLADVKTLIPAAINGTDGINTANASVTASAFTGDDCILTSIAAGVAGEAVATTETFDAATNVFDAATLGTTTEGVDGTVGEAGEQMIDTTYLYISFGKSTLGVGNWRRITLGAAF